METLLTVDAARTFPGRPESARAARIWAVSHLPPGSPAADDVALMVSELVTNALRYSRSALPGGSVAVSLAIGGGQVRVDVVDQGTLPALAWLVLVELKATSVRCRAGNRPRAGRHIRGRWPAQVVHARPRHHKHARPDFPAGRA